jgi:serine/threonine-protein kinase HipA
LRELEYASLKLEEDGIENSPEYLKWLNMLISPGSSLGGARPKASVLDEVGNLWIAKFPSQKDDINMGAWEMLAYQVAKDAGLRMDECKAQAFNSSQHTFMAKRFDRKGSERIHFASALTCLGKVDGEDGDKGVSYIHLAEFLAFNGSDTNRDLEELWRRIILNICISNVDDHLRNHGFLLNSDGWSLSPAYDINPSRDGDGLKLNISETDNAQDLNLALSVIGYFRIDLLKAKNIISEVKKAVGQWKRLAKELSISKVEQDRMERAFRLAK